ncbi:hypothetical protein CEXT_135921 [Caerostris extrusa]|uniref:Uncharacterized protein n=1 Tax=Caerostris extrusa TaxID=172846 RepID=A0AAV4PL65_CAEEX|nr:hypothetical protein CEXT_135921 [Caerostris extrusa]
MSIFPVPEGYTKKLSFPYTTGVGRKFEIFITSLRMNRDGGKFFQAKKRFFLEQKECQNVFDWDGGWKEKRSNDKGRLTLFEGTRLLGSPLMKSELKVCCWEVIKMILHSKNNRNKRDFEIKYSPQ